MDLPEGTEYVIVACACGDIHIVITKDTKPLARLTLTPQDAYSFTQKVLKAYDALEGL